ncbi:MAG TPA: hypothetical protein PKC20_02480, partial [Burkholderiaceae bacterium]|nr:hypothetical protein [Burkholderiaceae bacterium]
MLERIEGFGRRLLLIAGAALTVATLASCGGAGAGAGGSGATSGSGTVADISLSIDKPALPAPDGSTTATIVAQVKDAASNVLRGQQVAFSTTDRGVSLAP